jgi:hypothetical protein
MFIRDDPLALDQPNSLPPGATCSHDQSRSSRPDRGTVAWCLVLPSEFPAETLDSRPRTTLEQRLSTSRQLQIIPDLSRIREAESVLEWAALPDLPADVFSR